ncbi:hypothetical protein JCM8547_003315 [Rhodosporidiobolus lusitaniae]
MNRVDTLLGTPHVESVLRSPRVEHGDDSLWGAQSRSHAQANRRNSFDQPFSPLIGSPSSPSLSSSLRSKPRRTTSGSFFLSLTTRARPSLFQLLAFVFSSVALYRSFYSEAGLPPSIAWLRSATKDLSYSASPPSAPPPPSGRNPPSPLNNPTNILGLSAVVVGPRSLKAQYHRQPGACNSSELLRAVSRARIRPDGASRHVDYSVPPDAHSLSSFQFSYSLPAVGCREPHLYTPEEACDLLGAYGGVMFRGDSFVRHVVNALFILLSGREDGAVGEEGERCRGNAMFDDRKAHCREKSIVNSFSMPNPVCNGQVPIFFDLQAWGAQPSHLLLTSYTSWRSLLPPSLSTRSHIFIAGHGLHHHLNSLTGILGFIRPFLHLSSQIFPRPVGVWMGIHAPAPGKPERWREEQGERETKRYNKEVGGLLDALSPGEFVEEDGRMKWVDWYGVTDGAESYDGSHYSYQVNMEKVLILLNLLDTIWGEAVEAGGLLETF